MVCDVCKKKEATVYLTQIVEGKMQKVNLCESCSKEKGVTDPTSFALVDFLQGLGTAQEIDKNAALIHCPVCGFSQNDFKRTGRLGCSSCYQTFEKQIGNLLKTIQRGEKHVGKFPASARRLQEYSDRLQVLQGDLARAVDEENYEGAAVLRDLIRKLQADRPA
jgi:protein arginine kinase activator